MRIFEVALGKVGGSTVVAGQLASDLLAMRHDVIFFSLHKPLRLPISVRLVMPESPAYPTIPPSEALVTELAVAILNKASEAPPDIIHFHYAYPFISIIPLIKDALPDVPVVLTFHGTDVTEFMSNEKYRGVFQAAMRCADKFTVVSSYLRDALQSLTGVEATVIHNYVGRTIKPVHWRDGIIHISNQKPVKRFQDVLNVFRLVKNEIPGIKLHIIGNETELQSDGDIMAHGVMKDVFPVLRERKVSLLTSESEGFSLVALESMSCGVPVVATKAGGIEDVVANGMCGMLHEKGDIRGLSASVVRLLRDRDLNEEFSRRCVARVNETFLASKIVPQYAALFERLLRPSQVVRGS